MVENHFDQIYVLNLKKREDRLRTTEKRLKFAEIEKYTVFNGVDGIVAYKLWEVYSRENQFFRNSNYVGCALSHLSIYQHALEKGYEKVLIIEDDNRVNVNANKLVESIYPQVPEWELLYLGFIPLSDDCTKWDYNVFQLLPGHPHVAIAKNFWGLFAYGITQNLMKEMIEIYKKDFPMEIDRFFVNYVQPRGKSYGMTPQIFAADDGYSDNSNIVETGMLQRSIDARFGSITDYV
jgi:GR25 family glycosyltransferase involved in LPS biosynthesis